MRRWATITISGLSLLMTLAPGAAAPHPGASAGPPFTLRQANGVWWLVSPSLDEFFSRGVCCVNPGATWLEYDPKNPGYAAWRQYSDSGAWADATVERLKSWGFTTVGGWSDYATLTRSTRMNLAYTVVLHMGASAGAPWFDMWDPKVVAAMDSVAKSQILSVRDDPLLLGYYSDNELGWWNGALFRMTLQQKPESGQRRRLVRLLRDRYHSSWPALLKDFVPEAARTFETLDRRGTLFLRPGGDGIRTVARFMAIIADRYYSLVHGIVRKYDRRGLILGDRYQAFYYPEVAAASGRYVDLASTNLNANWNDGSYARFFLDTLHRLTGRPIMIGEFYMTAAENRSGNRNSSSGFPVVATQAERAAGFRTTLETLMRTPYVVGADWFQYYDEPTHGRGDGENYDMGLVDIEDRPYEPMVAAAAGLGGLRGEHSEPARPIDVSSGAPPAPAHPLAHAGLRGGLAAWDRGRGFVPAATSSPVADLYVCWDASSLYVGLYAMDLTEEAFYRDKRIPEADRALLELRIGGGPPIRVRLGSGRAPAVDPAEVAAADLSDSDREVHTIAAVRIPAALLGKTSLSAGDRVRLSATFETFARRGRIRWDTTIVLRPGRGPRGGTR